MSTNLDVYAFDDFPSHLTLLKEAVDNNIPDFNLIKCCIDSPESWERAAKTLSTITGDFAILLDLGFHENKPIFTCVIDQLTSELVNDNAGCKVDDKGNLIFPFEGTMREFPEEAVDGIALALAVLRNPNQGRTLIYIISGRGGAIGNLSPLLVLLEKYYSKENAKRRCCIVRDMDGRKASNADFAEDIVIAFKEKWIRTFPDFSSDPLINNCIEKWINFYRKLQSENNADNFCQHGTSSIQRTIDCNPEEYKNLLIQMFDIDCELPQDTSGIKALLTLDKEPQAGAVSKPEDWFRVWPPDETAAPVHPIKTGLLHAVLVAVFECEVKIELKYTPEKWYLPISPALPFILSLRALVTALRDEEDGRGILHEEDSVTLIGLDNATYRLSIPLKQDPSNFFGLAKTWVRKCETGGNQITVDGVCGTLWNTLLARIKVSDKAAQNDVEKALLRLFKGPGRPIAGVSFAPHAIYLHWS